MAMYSSSSSSSNNWALSLKVVLISTGVLSMAMAVKLSVPVVTNFVSSEIPSLWSFALSWLEPPYLYVIINCIILSIVASSKLQQKVDNPPPPSPLPDMMVVPPVTVETVKILDGNHDVVVGRTDYAAYTGLVLTGCGYDPNEVATAAKVSEAQITVAETAYAPPPIRQVLKEVSASTDRVVMNGGEETVVPSTTWNGLQRKDSAELCFSNENEKPPISARFGHRKAAKGSPEGGKSLRVSKPPKRQDTLENTWKTITEGRPIPLTRHLKKSDTWESHVRRSSQTRSECSSPPPAPKMKKSGTFSDRNSSTTQLSPASGGSGKLRKEPSLSQDDLNRRVEAFIKKFNEEMRLQRQESLNQYQEMISRGAH
ncbi:uncharacterized protein LOC133782615 [Humulus lupulus]|uniref:uncharacterized protein LOC133782615 n=1 Tax=Humulus lupulus TaxID=3486 RepID=UPI002B413500|nr:uncharacterized protein LOC133782615 [Humulus lupulus]